ncbi:MAG: winged helix-turn-helix transcriptional regulator [Maritimibacter sp.]|nr:winged helix-turn-helix transcriptional regulator [Maritimibacter sp.]
MVESKLTLDTIFHALGDGTRRQMLEALASGEKTVGELAEPFDISLAAASKHVKTLEKAGLLTRDIRWRTHVCRLAPGPLADAHAWLDSYSGFWTAHLDTLEALLKAEQAAGRDAGTSAPHPKKME